MTLVLNSSGDDSGLKAAFQTLLDSNSIFGDSGASAKVADIRSETALRKTAIQKIQSQMAREEEQRQAQMGLVQAMGQTVANAQAPTGQPLASPDQPQVYGPQQAPIQGPPEPNYTQAQQQQFQAIGQNHASELMNVAGFAARAGLNPQEAAVALNWTHQQHLQQVDTVRRQQNASTLAQQFQAGAFGDPKSPAVQAKAQELAQLAVDPNSHPDDVWRAAGPTLAAVEKDRQEKQDRAENVAQMTADAQAISEYTHQPLNPYQRSLLNQMATHQGDSPAIRAEWDQFGKLGLVPAKDWQGRTIGVPFDQVQSFAASQIAAVNRVAAAEAAAKEAAAGLSTAKAATGGFAPRAEPRGDNIKVPGEGSTYRISASQARVRGIQEAKSVAGDAWKAMSATDKEAAIQTATEKYTQENPSATDALMGGRSLPFLNGNAGPPLSSEMGGQARTSTDTGGTTNRDDFLKQWRAQNPKGTVEEARAAWAKQQGAK